MMQYLENFPIVENNFFFPVPSCSACNCAIGVDVGSQLHILPIQDWIFKC